MTRELEQQLKKHPWLKDCLENVVDDEKLIKKGVETWKLKALRKGKPTHIAVSLPISKDGPMRMAEAGLILADKKAEAARPKAKLKPKTDSEKKLEASNYKISEFEKENAALKKQLAGLQK